MFDLIQEATGTSPVSQPKVVPTSGRRVLLDALSASGAHSPRSDSFAGVCRDNGIALLAADGTNLLDSVMGGVNGMLAEMDRDATVARLAAGKKIKRAEGKRVEGRWPYGESPYVEHNDERAIVERMRQMHTKGISAYRIATQLRTEGILTRYGKEFSGQAVTNILRRVIDSAAQATVEGKG